MLTGVAKHLEQDLVLCSFCKHSWDYFDELKACNDSRRQDSHIGKGRATEEEDWQKERLGHQNGMNQNSGCLCNVRLLLACKNDSHCDSLG